MDRSGVCVCVSIPNPRGGDGLTDNLKSINENGLVSSTACF